MWTKWLPWRFVLSQIARRQGFVDPISIVSQFSRFSQPSEVLAPGELLRAGLIFHARGLVNSQAIQHNLDWVWPYWVEKQFDPSSASFVPRAFSLTHINLTHRNWTAVGIPDCRQMPIVDPRGLVTPHFDGWSIDGWIIADDGVELLPSRLPSLEQREIMNSTFAISTAGSSRGLALESVASVLSESNLPVCRIKYRARADRRAWFVLSIRPYNPEGISFIHDISAQASLQGWTVNKEHRVTVEPAFERHTMSHYRLGDVYHDILKKQRRDAVRCEVGMASAAGLYALQPDTEREIEVAIPLKKKRSARPRAAESIKFSGWHEALEGHCTLQGPDAQYQFLYESSIRTLILHTPGTIFAGPYTYKRFWFRDAAFILHSLLAAGLWQRAEHIIDRFPKRQTAFGYFESQNGEWDSNGQVLWLMRRFVELTGRTPKSRWRGPIYRAGHWIERKRLSSDISAPHAGLLPPGFSAEHLGPNDFYYWDDFWGVSGLRAASFFARLYDDPQLGAQFEQSAQELENSIEQSLLEIEKRTGRSAIPSSPYRRLDSASVGSLAAGYPLHLRAPNDRRLLDTADFLYQNCRSHGAFFHDMTHSGINPYLTLHIAQVYMRAGDARAFELINALATLCSPTGQWPEAIHPNTRGGCMGDGQHTWAAAEWLMIVRNSFIREETADEKLVLCAGLPREWLDHPEEIHFGPAPTAYGPVSITIQKQESGISVKWQGDWRARPPHIEVAPVWHERVRAPADARSATLRLE